MRDLAALYVKLLELPDGAHRYAAAADMVSWPEYYRLPVGLTGRRIRHISVPGWLLRAAGSAGGELMQFGYAAVLIADRSEFV